MNGIIQAPSSLLLAALFAASGCEGWPTHANLPADPIDAVTVENSAAGVQVAWAAPVREEDPGNETPPEAFSLALEEGVVVYGSLAGAGWDPLAAPDHLVNCDGVDVSSEYPPLSQGAYTADEDWISLVPAADAQLCVTMEIDLPEELGDELFYDMIAYELDACSNPLTLLRDDLGEPLGLGLFRASAAYSADVRADQTLGVLVAGVLAADLSELAIPWRLGLSLVPSEANGGNGACPTLPEAP